MKKSRTFLMVTLMLLFIGFVSATTYPHAFRGYAFYESNKVVPNGYIITAGIDGVISGSSVVSSGFYDLVVEGSRNGQDIKFYINGEEMNEKRDFFSFEITDLNLTVDSLPTTDTFCGDDICSSSECSFCSVDCSPADCSGNGACDTNIGETCSTATSDCGACPTCGDGSCNGAETCSTCSSDCGSCSSGGGSGGGGGGGGSSSSSSSQNLGETLAINEVAQESENENLPKPLETINKEEVEKEESPPFFSRLTGAAIGVFGPTNGFIGWIIIFVVIGTVVYLKLKNKEKVVPLTRGQARKYSKGKAKR
jgi:uncharacterized membrane protein YgcG